jgi:hypothetical protein
MMEERWFSPDEIQRCGVISRPAHFACGRRRHEAMRAWRRSQLPEDAS